MNMPNRLYLRVPTHTIVLTIFAAASLISLAGYLYFNTTSIPQYLFFILSFAGFLVGLSVFKIIWWNVLHRGWLEVQPYAISMVKYFSTEVVKTSDIFDIIIPGYNNDDPLTDCINISTIASHLQQPTLRMIIPLVFFQRDDKEMLPLLLNSVAK